MSGQQTIQELDRIVGTTNELLLSPEAKMMDVGGGVMRPTNAMVMTNLATMLGGAMPYASVALGLSGTVDGTNFSVLSSAQDEYVNVYRNVGGSAVFVDSYPNSQAVKLVKQQADAADAAISQVNDSVQQVKQQADAADESILQVGQSVQQNAQDITRINQDVNQLHGGLEENSKQIATVEEAANQNAHNIEQVGSQIKQFPSEDMDVVRLRQVDTEGSVIVQLSDKALNTIPFSLMIDAASTTLCDGEGTVVFLDEPGRTIVGPFEMQTTDAPGIYATDIEGALLGVDDEVVVQSPFDGGLLFSPMIATSPAIKSMLYPQSILQYRERDAGVIATLSSASTTESASGRAIAIDAERYGPAAMLGMRRLDEPGDHRFMPLNLVHVPIQSSPVPIKVLVIGDSIGNRQGATLTRQYLEAQGFSVNLIGTMPGSALPNDPNNATGGLGEAREGWETGDYTYAQTDMANIVAPGGEAAYLSGSKSYKYSRNPFLRAATGSDDPALVRNGYIFDPAFYQARFGLEAPNVVLNLLGTNDASHRTDATVYAEVLANDTLMHSQMIAAWPDVKIIRSVPGTSFDTTRNALWSASYAPVIRAIKDAAFGNSAVIVAPVWAMTDPESGYPISASAPGVDGFVSGNFSDVTHPQGSSRHSLFATLAPFIAAAALGLI